VLEDELEELLDEELELLLLDDPDELLEDELAELLDKELKMLLLDALDELLEDAPAELLDEELQLPDEDDEPDDDDELLLRMTIFITPVPEEIAMPFAANRVWPPMLMPPSSSRPIDTVFSDWAVALLTSTKLNTISELVSWNSPGVTETTVRTRVPVA
jgi:hypothetical protein